MSFSDYVSATEAAEIIGCTTGRVRQLCREGVLDAELFNEKAWAVRKSSAKKYAKQEITRGRPRGTSERAS